MEQCGRSIRFRMSKVIAGYRWAGGLHILKGIQVVFTPEQRRESDGLKLTPLGSD